MFQQIVLAILAVSSTMTSIFLIIKQKQSGISEIDQRTITALQTRNKQLEEEYPREKKELQDQIQKMQLDFQKQFTEQAEKIALLTGKLEEKDKRIDELTHILQDRNPETLTLIKEVKEILSKFVESNQEDRKTTSEMLDYQTQLLQAIQNK